MRCRRGTSIHTRCSPLDWGMATVGVVEDEGLLEDEVDDGRTGQLRHEGLDGSPGIGGEGCQWQQQHGRQRSETAAHALVIRGRRG